MTGGKDRENLYTRTEMILGENGVKRLKDSRVIVFGVGGVGGYAVEALARAGIGSLTLVDGDRVSASNLNRQIIATVSTVGTLKTEAAKERILSINPNAEVITHSIFYSEETAGELSLSDYDYVIDAIDSIKSKVLLISECHRAGVKIISSMGAGRKLDPTAFRVSDISKTKADPLAREVRTRLRRMGINHLKVVYSEEPPVGAAEKGAPGSISFVPSTVGLIMAGEAIKELSGYYEDLSDVNT